MKDVPVNFPIGRQINLPGHFDVPIILEAVRQLARGLEFRVRLPNGSLEEAAFLAEGLIPTEKRPLLATLVSWPNQPLSGSLTPMNNKREKYEKRKIWL